MPTSTISPASFYPSLTQTDFKEVGEGDDLFRKGGFSSLVYFLVNKDEDTTSLAGSELPVPVQGHRFVNLMA